jgi:hypothetical protein
MAAYIESTQVIGLKKPGIMSSYENVRGHVKHNG